MAQPFNIDQPSKDADYTDKSKGITPDLSTASLFESVATIGDSAIKGINELFKTKIRDDATEGVDAIRDREINMGAQQKGYGTQVPAEINTAANRLQTMKNAKESGQIGDSHYFLLLDSEARRLRSRYPGHREYVDNVMQDLTGVNPANHAIGLMKAELNKENKDSPLLNEYHFARDHGTPLAELLAKGETPDLQTARAINAKWGVIQGSKKAFDAQLSTDEHLRKANEHKMEQHANEVVFGTEGIYTEAAMKSQGVDTQALAKAATGYRDQISSGIAEPEARKALNVELAKYKEASFQRLNDHLDQVRNDSNGKPYTLRSGLSNDAAKRIEERFSKEIETRTKAYKEGNIDYMSIDADTVKASENIAIQKLVNEAPYMARVDAHRKLGGDQLTSLMLGESSAFLTAEHRLFQRYIVQGISGEGKEKAEGTLKEAELRMKEAGIPPEDIANLKRLSIKGISDALSSGKLTPEQTKATALWLYSGDPQNKDFYAKAGSYQEPLFKQLLQPGITKAIMESKDPVIRDNYIKFVDTAVGNRVVKDFENIRGLENTPSIHGVKYNPETNLFERTILQSKIQANAATGKDANAALYGANNSAFVSRATQIAESLNTTMNHYKPVADALKQDPNIYVQNSLAMNGLMLGPDNEVIKIPKEPLSKPVNTNTPAATRTTPTGPGTNKSALEPQGDTQTVAGKQQGQIVPSFDTTTQPTVPNFAGNLGDVIPGGPTLTAEDRRVNPTQENLRNLNPVTMDELRKAQEDQKAGRPISPRVQRAIDQLKQNIMKRPEGR